MLYNAGAKPMCRAWFDKQGFIAIPIRTGDAFSDPTCTNYIYIRRSKEISRQRLL